MGNTVKNGKGSTPRPVRSLQDYGERFDAITWPSRPKDSAVDKPAEEPTESRQSNSIMDKG